MEITSTVVTKTARHQTEEESFNLDYIMTNGALDNVQVSIFHLPQENLEEQYLGSVSFDGRSISCNIPWSDGVSGYFETAIGFIAQIIESVGYEPAAEEPNNDKSR